MSSAYLMLDKDWLFTMNVPLMIFLRDMGFIYLVLLWKQILSFAYGWLQLYILFAIFKILSVPRSSRFNHLYRDFVVTSSFIIFHRIYNSFYFTFSYHFSCQFCFRFWFSFGSDVMEQLINIFYPFENILYPLYCFYSQLNVEVQISDP